MSCCVEASIGGKGVFGQQRQEQAAPEELQTCGDAILVAAEIEESILGRPHTTPLRAQDTPASVIWPTRVRDSGPLVLCIHTCGDAL